MQEGTIIYSGLYLLPNQDAAAHRVHGICNILIELGYRIVVIGMSDDPDSVSKWNTLNRNIKYYSEIRPKTKKEWLRTQLTCDQTIKAIEKEEDVRAVFLYNYPAVPFEKIYRMCKKKGIKLISDCTEWYHAGKGSNLAFIKNADTWKRIHIDDHRSDGIVVISSFLKDYYRKDKTVLIPPVFDYDIMRKNSAQLNATKRVFVFTGTVSEQKETVTDILKAATQLEIENYRFEVRIYGISEEDYKNRFNIDEQYLVKSIRFYGRVPHETCIEEVRNAHFLIFVREVNRVNTAGFSTKFAESYSCGTPVITTDTSDISSYLEDGVNGLLIKDSVYDAMKKALDMSDNDYKRIRENAEQQKSFDYRHYIEMMKEFID